MHWVEGREALEPCLDAWWALAERCGADIYMSPGWLLSWWDHFGAGHRLLCLMAEAPDGHLAGILPFMIETVWAGPVPVRVARLAGTDPHCVLFRLAVEETLLPPMMNRALADLLCDKGADLVSFTPASERGPLVDVVRAALPPDILLIDRPAGTHTVFDLPDSFDAYLAGLSKKRRGQFRRDLRKLQADHGLQTALTHPGAAQIDDFISFHNRQWQKTGKGGHFCDWPGSAAFYRDLAERLQSEGSVWIDHQDGSAGPLAAQFGLVSGQSCHWRLPARATEPEFDRLSVGTVGLILMIERLIGVGVTRIEAGGGAYDYKLVYGGESVLVHRMIITRPGRAQRKTAVLMAWARALHLGYYRAWFCRAAPRLRRWLPLPHWPLWKSWIKSRV